MIGRNDLVGSIVSRPGERPRMRVLAGPGWVAGEHGQDLAEGCKRLTATHGGEWSEVSRSPGAQVARCSAKACAWATRPIRHGRPTPATCEACGAPAALAAVLDAGEAIVLEQAVAPTPAWRAEKAFRAARPRLRASAARTWAKALLEERRVPAGAASGLLLELASRRAGQLQPADLEQLVRRGVEQAQQLLPADAPARGVPNLHAAGQAIELITKAAKTTRKRTKKAT